MTQTVSTVIYTSVGYQECIDADPLQHYQGSYPAGIIIVIFKKEGLKERKEYVI